MWKVAKSKAPTRLGLLIQSSQDPRNPPSKIEARMLKWELSVPELMPALHGTQRSHDLHLFTDLVTWTASSGFLFQGTVSI